MLSDEVKAAAERSVKRRAAGKLPTAETRWNAIVSIYPNAHNESGDNGVLDAMSADDYTLANDWLRRYEAGEFADYARLLAERDELAKAKELLNRTLTSAGETQVSLARKVKDLQAGRDEAVKLIREIANTPPIPSTNGEWIVNTSRDFLAKLEGKNAD